MNKNKLNLDDIKTIKMHKPKYSKLKHYETYFLETGKLCHDIYINENNEIVDGYCSYLISKKYNYIDVKIHMIKNKFRKVVLCRFLKIKNNKTKLSNKKYWFKYSLKNAVVPGDVVLINNEHHKIPLVVEKVTHIDPMELNSITKGISKHTNHKYSN